MSAPSTIPAWLQAVAAVLSLGATAWLAWLTSRYVKATDLIAKASKQQVADALSLVQENRRGIAASLLADLARIRSELGPVPEDEALHMAHRGVLVPEVHPWMRSLIPSLGAFAPQAVAEFLTLDRDLHNYRVAHDTLAQAESARDEQQRARDTFDGIYQGTGVPLNELSHDMELKRTMRVAEENLERAYALAGSHYRMCHATLARIADILRPIAG
jgi:hypothetical protein